MFNLADSSQSLQQDYTITPRKIGEGAHGQVFMAIKKKTKMQLACKIVNICPSAAADTQISEDHVDIRDKIKMEASILKPLKHVSPGCFCLKNI